MFAVVNLHGLRVNVRFERVVSVRQRRQCERPARSGSRRGGICLGECAGQNRNGGAGERSGFNGLASGHHNRVLVLGSRNINFDTRHRIKVHASREKIYLDGLAFQTARVSAEPWLRTPLSVRISSVAANISLREKTSVSPP